jgi:hypothetical protein
MKDWIDDKMLVILGLILIAIALILMSIHGPLPEQNMGTLNQIVSGLLGVAVGRAIPAKK